MEPLVARLAAKGFVADSSPVTSAGMRRVALLLPKNRRRVMEESIRIFRTEVATAVLAATTVEEATIRLNDRPFAAAVLASATAVLHGYQWPAIDATLTKAATETPGGIGKHLASRTAVTLEHVLQTIAVTRRTMHRQFERAVDAGARAEDLLGRPSFVALHEIGQRTDVLLTVCLMGALREVRVRRIAVLNEIIRQLYDLSSAQYDAAEAWMRDVRALLPAATETVATATDAIGTEVATEYVMRSTRRRVASIRERRIRGS